MNLLDETINLLQEYEKYPDDIHWIGSNDGKYACTWDEFKVLANFEYDEGFGGEEVATDLVVVGTDWWLERGEYDGSEWWQFKRLPILQKISKPIKSLRAYSSLDEDTYGSKISP